MKRVEGKTIIVTGGSVGVGRAISFILAQEGAYVAVTDVQDAPVTSASRRISHGASYILPPINQNLSLAANR